MSFSFIPQAKRFFSLSLSEMVKNAYSDPMPLSVKAALGFQDNILPFISANIYN